MSNFIGKMIVATLEVLFSLIVTSFMKVFRQILLHIILVSLAIVCTGGLVFTIGVSYRNECPIEPYLPVVYLVS